MIKVRTVKSRQDIDRWRAQAIQDIVASPRAPNPNDRLQGEALPERLTKGADPGGGTGESLPDAVTADADFEVRDFKITKSLIERFGFTEGCKGCVGHLVGSRRVCLCVCV